MRSLFINRIVSSKYGFEARFSSINIIQSYPPTHPD